MRVYSTLLMTLLALATTAAHAEGSAAEWAEKIKISGDLRLRHDYFKTEQEPPEMSARHRERFRLRITTTAEINESVKAKVRLASSEAGSGINASSNVPDPISTNQSMDNNANKKDIWIDVAMAEWKMCDNATLNAGKQDNPLRIVSGSQLMFDGDYTPEGVSVVSKDLAGTPLFLTAGAFVLDERNVKANGNSDPDGPQYSGLLGVKMDNSEGVTYMVAVGYHNFAHMLRQPVLTGASGNTLTAGEYDHRYEVTEILAEAKTKVGQMGLTVFADAISNSGAEEHNTGMQAGASLQTVNEEGKPNWTFGYSYLTTGADATVSSINNSDAANGQDGAMGHIISVGKVLAKNVTGQILYHHMKVNVPNGEAFWTDRAFADVMFTF